MGSSRIISSPSVFLRPSMYPFLFPPIILCLPPPAPPRSLRECSPIIGRIRLPLCRRRIPSAPAHETGDCCPPAAVGPCISDIIEPLAGRHESNIMTTAKADAAHGPIPPPKKNVADGNGDQAKPRQRLRFSGQIRGGGLACG